MAPGPALQRNLHRLDEAAEGLRQVGRTRLPVGEALAWRNTARPRSSTWWWEVWNEANNQPSGYWGGTPRGFSQAARLRRRRRAPRAAHGAGRRAALRRSRRPVHDGLPRALPARHQLRDRAKGTPLDFVAFHAKGLPTTCDGHVRMGISKQLKTIETAFTTIASYPELKDNPCHHRRVRSRGLRRLPGPAAGLPQRHDVFQLHRGGFRPEARTSPTGAASTSRVRVTWAFSFEDQPWFAGFRSAGQQRRADGGVQCLPDVSQ
jgi:xylan 1,4-beta-xylosidase